MKGWGLNKGFRGNPIFKKGMYMRVGLIVSVVFWGAVVMFNTGCAISGTGGDYVQLQGTPKGMQAFADLTNGMIRTGKESPDKPSEFFAHRGTQEREITNRKAQAVGFWQRLIN